MGFGKNANPATRGTHREKYGSVYSIGFGNARLYFNGVRLSGGHNNVILEMLGASTVGNALEQSTLGIVQYEGFSHTHPYCTGHDNNNFSGIIGDQGAAILTGKVYITTPSGEVKYITRESAIAAMILGENINTTVKTDGVDVPKYFQIVGSVEGYGGKRSDCSGMTEWNLFWGNEK